MSGNDPVFLDGLRILVPRPSPQGDSLVAEIRAHGGYATHFPVLRTVEPEYFEPVDRVLENAGNYSLFIIVSVAAANALSARMQALGIAMPETARVASVGPATTAALRQLGMPVHFEPHDDYSSEGLLEQLEQVQWAGKRIAVFRGQNGRELVRRALQQRGACVEMVCSYHRILSDQPFDPVVDAWKKTPFDAVVITSNAVFDALLALLDPSDHYLLHDVTGVAISQRIRNYCIHRGMRDVIPTAPGNEPVLRTLGILQGRKFAQ